MTLKWSIPELLEHQKKGFAIDTTISVEDLKERDAEVRNTSPVHITGHADFTRNTVTFFLTISGQLTLPDAVTLDDVNYPFHIQTSEKFRLNNRPMSDDNDDETEVHDVESQTIDLLPYIKEAILVEKPIRIVNKEREDQPSLNGNGWQLITESERSGQVDPRFEKLKGLFNE